MTENPGHIEGHIEDHIKTLVTANIPDAHVTISDMRGDGAHYAVYIESPSFVGKTRVEQHRMVYKALSGILDDTLQGLAIQTALPPEYRDRR